MLNIVAIRAIYAKWNAVPDYEQYYENENSTFPAMLGYFHKQGWDLRYHKGSYSIPDNQLDFFLLTL